MRSSASAWPTVRGKPSSTKPRRASGAREALLRHADHDGVGHELAALHDRRAPGDRAPIPDATAARSMSPVEICGMPSLRTRRSACVPLPAPGGPSSKQPPRAHRPSLPRMRVPCTKPSYWRETRCASICAIVSSPTPDHDQQRRAAEVERHARAHRQQGGQHAHRRHVERADQRDAREDAVDVLGGLLARADAGDVGARALDVLGDVGRVDHDRRVEVAEEDDQSDVEQLVERSSAGSR